MEIIFGILILFSGVAIVGGMIILFRLEKHRSEFYENFFTRDILAKQREEARREEIQGNIERINFYFSGAAKPQDKGASREKSARVREGAFNLFLPEPNNQKNDATRASKFQLARQGLLGVRAQVDNKGEITQRAIAAENQARAARQRTKVELIARAQAGEDITGLLADGQRSLAAAAAQGSLACRPLDLSENFFYKTFKNFEDSHEKLGIKIGITHSQTH